MGLAMTIQSCRDGTRIQTSAKPYCCRTRSASNK